VKTKVPAVRTALLLAALLALPAFAFAETMQPGMYRSTSVVPGEKPETSEECVTQKDIDDGLSALGASRDASCKVQDSKRGANSVSYRTACSANGMNVTSDVKVAFTRDTFDMNLAMTVAGETTKIRVSGKRIGPCK
jgi:hypothetical protein